jgi:predicted PurR-regulated permease PerM
MASWFCFLIQCAGWNKMSSDPQVGDGRDANDMRPGRETPVASRLQLQTALGLLVGIAVLYLGREILMPIALALLLSFLLAPAMVRLQRWGLGKTLAALVVVALPFLGLIFVCWVGFGQAYNLTLELPAYRQNISKKLHALTPPGLHRFGETQRMLGEVTGELTAQNQDQKYQTSSGKSQSSSQAPIAVEVRQPEPTSLEFLEKTAGSALRPLATAFIVLVFVIFMLLGREDLRDRVLRLAGSSRLYMTTQALDDAARRVSRYLLMQLAVNAIYGASVGLALLLIGIPHPLVWAVLATLLRFIPYVGPWIAATGPILLAIGVAPGWAKFAWTLGLYVVLEVVAANFVEPFLYGSSTGISAIAILVAAVFWTWLWGPVALLLSTPLTVCLVVVGRYVPHLEFLGILFGDEPVLSEAQRFYQRMIAKDAEEAAELTEQLLKEKSVIDVYDEVIVPAMSLAEEGRHAGFLDSETQVYFLENTRELVDEIGTRGVSGSGENRISAKLICLPAKDAADELACQILAQLLPSAAVQLTPLGISTNDLVKAISTARPTVVCISGVPPQATRHVAVRCRHLRKLFPDLIIMAAVWSDADLTSVRSRIPVSDANHVVCTFKQAIEYIANIENPISTPADSSVKPSDDQAAEEQISALDSLDTSNIPVQDVLDRIVQDLAKTLNAPIAFLTITDEAGKIWKSQSGLPSDLASAVETIEHFLRSSIRKEKSAVVIEDMLNDQRFASSPLFSQKGVHFCAAEPLLNRNGKIIGLLVVLDTRSRSISEQEAELLHKGAKAAVEAFEVRAVAPTPEADAESVVHRT